jgi:hypothetical protein
LEVIVAQFNHLVQSLAGLHPALQPAHKQFPQEVRSTQLNEIRAIRAAQPNTRRELFGFIKSIFCVFQIYDIRELNRSISY